MIEQIDEVGGHALDRRCTVLWRRMLAMAAGVPADDAVLAGQPGKEGKPLLVVGSPAVQHDDRQATDGRTGIVNVDLLAVVGKEMAHRVLVV